MGNTSFLLHWMCAHECMYVSDFVKFWARVICCFAKKCRHKTQSLACRFIYFRFQRCRRATFALKNRKRNLKNPKEPKNNRILKKLTPKEPEKETLESKVLMVDAKRNPLFFLDAKVSPKWLVAYVKVRTPWGQFKPPRGSMRPGRSDHFTQALGECTAGVSGIKAEL